MLDTIIRYFKDKRNLIREIEQLERENEALDLEVFNLEKELEGAYSSLRRRSDSLNALQLLVVTKNADIAIIKEESRKLFYHTTELLQNTHLTPVGELEDALLMVERLTRSDQDANA